MLRNYIKIAFRNLVRNKMFSLINILGLTIAMTFAIIIFIWMKYESSYDDFHSNRIYFVQTLFSDNQGNLNTGKNTSAPLANSLVNDISEIQFATRFYDDWTGVVTNDQEKYNENLSFVDPSFFAIFNFPFVAGSRHQTLQDPYSVVITKSIAIKYFNHTDVVGKHLHIKESNLDHDFMISAVVDNPPSNSTIQFDILLPFETIRPYHEWMHWGSQFLDTYVMVSKDVLKEVVDLKIRDIPEKYGSPRNRLFLHPFEDIHLYNKVKANVLSTEEIVYNLGGRIRYVHLFGMVALAILILGCINFMNLSTALAGKRAKEIGLRKMTGASRFSVIAQFLGEAIWLALISGGLALLLAHLLLPWSATIFGKHLDVPYGDRQFILFITLIPVIVGLLAGSYPALFLSSLRPANAMKHAVFGKYNAGFLRQGLVVFQMAVSVVLLCATFVILAQIRYIRDKDLGLNKDNIVFFPFYENILSQQSAFENAIKQSPYVLNFCFTSSNPLNTARSTGNVEWEGMEQDDNLTFAVINSGKGFVETAGIRLKEGHSFSFNTQNEVQYLINEVAAKMMGSDNPVGKPMIVWNGEGPIVGVIENFHYRSMHKSIDPLVIRYSPKETYFVMAKIEGTATIQAMADLQAIYSTFEKDYAFEYHFLDETYEELYDQEILLGKLSNIFAFLAILISCLGLYGLIAYTAQRKRKEISIRKVNGATIRSVLFLFSSVFMKWILLANLVAWPIAWYLMRNWLEGYSYYIKLEWQYFAGAGLTTLLIAWITVGIQTVKAATVNPIKVLRAE